MELFPELEFDDNRSDGGDAAPEPLVPEVAGGVWKELCAAALLVREREPWKTLRDSELIGVRDPESGEVMLLSVLGGDRNVFAVHLHLPPEGQRFWRNTLETGLPDENLMPFGLRMLECEWQNKGTCETEDIEIWERYGKGSRKRHWWPGFRSWLPGYSPWFVNEAEARLLTISLELLNRFFGDAEKKRCSVVSEFPGPSLSGMPDWIPLYELKKNGEAECCDDWRLTRADLPDPGSPPPAAEPEDELFAARLSRLPVTGGVWEIGAAWQPTTAFEPGEDRPYFLKAAVCLDQQSQSMPLPELYGGRTSDGDALRKVFAALAEAENCLPTELRVASDTAEAALRSVASSTAMEITRSPLEVVPQMLAMLSQFAGGDGPSEDLLKMFEEDLESVAGAMPVHPTGAPSGHVPGIDPASLLAALGGGSGDIFSSLSDDVEEIQLPVPTGEERYTLRISLRYIQPEIWRRITIAADATFYHLHDAIQTVMPWDCSHLYEFVLGSTRRAPRVGTEPDCDYPIATTRLIDVIGARKKKFSYIYDFGDDWVHEIKVEKKTRESTPDPQTHVLDGEGIAPPEDCGGIGGFYALLSGESEWSEEWGEEALEHWRSGRFNPKNVEFWPVEKLEYSPRPLF